MADSDDYASEFANVPGAQNAEQIETISPNEALQRQRSGGFLANGKPAPAAAMVDQEGSQMDPSVAARHQKIQQAASNQVDQLSDQAKQGPPPAQSTAPLTPYEVGMKDYNPDTLRAVAKAAGIDTSKLPDSYFEGMSQHYDDIQKPSTLNNIRHWYQASGIGQFAAGMDADGHDVLGVDSIPGGNRAAVAEIKATQFFNAHIQSRIIEDGKYIDGNGNYNPPDSYKAGHAIGSLVANPSQNLAAVAAARSAGLGAKMAVNGTLTYMAAHPAVGQVMGRTLKYGALYAVAKSLLGGGKVPFMD
jgi:hypothetical protein